MQKEKCKSKNKQGLAGDRAGGRASASDLGGQGRAGLAPPRAPRWHPGSCRTGSGEALNSRPFWMSGPSGSPKWLHVSSRCRPRGQNLQSLLFPPEPRECQVRLPHPDASPEFLPARLQPSSLPCPVLPCFALGRPPSLPACPPVSSASGKSWRGECRAPNSPRGQRLRSGRWQRAAAAAAARAPSCSQRPLLPRPQSES